MKIEYDTRKNRQNIEKHGFSLNAFALLDFSVAQIIPDARRDYGEERIRIFAPIDGRLCSATYTMRGNTIRVISLRKANKRERRSYETRNL